MSFRNQSRQEDGRVEEAKQPPPRPTPARQQPSREPQASPKVVKESFGDRK